MFLPPVWLFQNTIVMFWKEDTLRKFDNKVIVSSPDFKGDCQLWCGLFTRGTVWRWNEDCGTAVQLWRHSGNPQLQEISVTREKLMRMEVSCFFRCLVLVSSCKNQFFCDCLRYRWWSCHAILPGRLTWVLIWWSSWTHSSTKERSTRKSNYPL